MCLFVLVLEYATLAINISLLQHSHLKLDTLDRKEQIFCAKTRLILIHQSSLNPPDRATTISRLMITQSIVVQESVVEKMNVVDDVRI